MNPYDQLGYIQLGGLGELNGYFSKLKKKIKHGIRRVAKVVAPVAAFVVGGPAAAVAVGKAVLESEKAGNAARKEAKKMGVSWTQYKRMAEGNDPSQQVVKLTGNPNAPDLINKARLTVNTMQDSPEYAQITQQLIAQGYTPEQAREMFAQSRPVQDIIQTTTAATIYGGARQAGYSPEQSIVTAGEAVNQAEKADGLKSVLPLALPVAALLLS